MTDANTTDQAILRVTTQRGESHDFVLGEGQHATLTVPRRWRPRTYTIELVKVGGRVCPVCDRALTDHTAEERKACLRELRRRQIGQKVTDE